MDDSLLSRIADLIQAESGRRLLILMPSRLSALAARRELGMRLSGLCTARIEAIDWLEHLLQAPASKTPGPLQLSLALRKALLESKEGALQPLSPEAMNLYCSPPVIGKLSDAVRELIEAGITPAQLADSGADRTLIHALTTVVQKFKIDLAEAGPAEVGLAEVEVTPDSAQSPLAELDLVVPCIADDEFTSTQLVLLRRVNEAGKLGVNLAAAQPLADIEKVMDGAQIHFTPDVTVEIQCTMAAVLDQIQSGIRPDQIAILYPIAHPYAPLIRAALQSAGIHGYGETGTSLGKTNLWQFTDRLFDLGNSPAVDEALDQLLSLAVESNAIRPEILRQFRSFEVTGSLERFHLAAQAKGGELYEVISGITKLTERLNRCKTWDQYAEWVLEAFKVLKTQDRQLVTAAEGLRDLDLLNPNPQKDEVRFAFQTIGAGRRRPAEKLQQGVYFGSYASAKGMEFASIFGLGFQEHLVPPDGTLDAFLPDDVREKLGLPTDSLYRERAKSSLAETLASGDHLRIFCAATEADGSREAFPSRYLAEEIRKRVADSGEDPNHFFPKTHRILGLKNCFQTHSTVDAVQNLTPFSPIAEAARLVMTGANRAQIPRIEGDFDSTLGAVPLNQWPSFSPTNFEYILECPLRFFYKAILRIDDRDRKESGWRLRSLDKGSFVHAVLKSWALLYCDHAAAKDLASWCEADQLADVSPPPIDPNLQREIEEMPEELRQAASLTSAFSILFSRATQELEAAHRVIPGPAWEAQKSNLSTRLLAYVTTESQKLCSEGRIPILLESKFQLHFKGLSGTDSEGDAIEVRGRLDRADLGPGGEFYVTDYKSGTLPELKKRAYWQLPIYGAAVRAQHADSAAVAKGQYINPLKGESSPDKGGWLELNPDWLTERIQDSAHLMKSGLFAPVPNEEDFGYCGYCSFRMACPAARTAIYNSIKNDERWKRLENLFEPTLAGKRIVLDAKSGAGSEPAKEEHDGQTAVEPYPFELEADSPPLEEFDQEWGGLEQVEMDDRPARDAATFNTHLHTFIEAGAGSGKTTTLVARISESLLREENPILPRELVAITFTEKAGGELRARIRAHLHQKVESEATTAKKQGAMEALAHLDEARIGTIHSFCLDLLRQFGGELGLPPLVQAIDDTEFKQHESQFISDLRRRSRDPEVAKRWEALYRVGVEDPKAIELARLIFQHSFSLLLDGLVLERAVTDRKDHREELWQVLREVAKIDLSQLQSKSLLFKELAFLSPLAEKGKELALLEVFEGAWEEFENKPGQGKASQIQAYHAAFPIHEKFIAAVRACKMEAIDPVLDLVVEQAKVAAQNLLYAGLLPFDAQILCAKKLVSGSSRGASFAAKGIGALFVDEFQDTDPHQALIFDRLMELNPRLIAFFVGDPKQSIYGFRGADLPTYQATKRRLRGLIDSSQHLTLNSNFRSRAPILGFVDRVFNIKLSEQLGNFDSLRACASLSLNFAPPAVRILPKHQGDAATVRALEAKSVADAILDLCGPGKHFRYQDAALLIAARSQLTEFQKAFGDKHIPYRLMMDVEMLETQEAADLRSIVQWLANPLDRTALLGALRSPLFSYSLAQLHQFFTSEGASNAIITEKRDALLNLCQGATMAVVVQVIADACGYLQNGMGQVEYRARLSRWNRLQLIAAEFDDVSGGGLAEFALHLEKMIQSEARHKGEVVAEFDNDAVSIYTVQSAKGLEFPVVICCNLGRNQKANSAPLLVQSAPQLMSWKIDKVTGSESAAKDMENVKKKIQEEAWRLAYVAATRAQDILIVSLSHPDSAKSCLAAEIQNKLGHFPTYKPGQHEPAPIPFPTALPLGQPVDWNWMMSVGGIATVSPSGLAHSLPKREFDEEDEFEDVLQNRETGFAVNPSGDEGIRFGRAFHSLMQSHPMDRPQSESILGQIVEAEGLAPNRVGDLRQAEKRALLALADLPSPGKILRETFVSAKIGNGLLEGYIDLYSESAEGVTVVDYKTDRVTTAQELAERFQRYQLQAGAYALMLSRAGKQVNAVRFIFVMAAFASGPAEYTAIASGDRLASLMQEAEQAAILSMT